MAKCPYCKQVVTLDKTRRESADASVPEAVRSVWIDQERDHVFVPPLRFSARIRILPCGCVNRPPIARTQGRQLSLSLTGMAIVIERQIVKGM